MNDLLKVVGEPVAWISLNTITGKTHLGIMPLQSLQAGVYKHAKLYTDDAIQAAYAKGQEDMRERAAKECEKAQYEDGNAWLNETERAINCCLEMLCDDIRALPIEGEQGWKP